MAARPVISICGIRSRTRPPKCAAASPRLRPTCPEFTSPSSCRAWPGAWISWPSCDPSTTSIPATIAACIGRPPAGPYRVDSTLIHPSRTDQPGVGTLVGWLAQRDGFSRGVPPYVITPFPHCDSKVYITPGQYGGCLGARYDPFVLDDDPNAANFKVRNLALDASLTVDRLQDRLGLLHDLTARSWRLLAANAELDIFTQQAASILQSGKAAEAFDLSKEPDAVRERYGRHSWGSRTCSRGAWSRPARASSPRSMARASTGTRTRTISTGSRTNSFLDGTGPMPRCSMTSTNAASSTPRCRLDGRVCRTPKINVDAGVTIGPDRTACCSPAAASAADKSSVRPTASAPSPRTADHARRDSRHHVCGPGLRRAKYHLPVGRRTPIALTEGAPMSELF